MSGPTTVSWLDGPRRHGATWGVPWPRGTVAADSRFALADGTPVQSWVTATWPDGSVKWSAHALSPAGPPLSAYQLIPGREPSVPPEPVSVRDSEGEVRVATGPVTWTLRAPWVIAAIEHDGRPIVREVRPVSLRQHEPDEGGSRERVPGTGVVEQVTVEQDGPVRAVVRLDGRHGDWLPFSIRLYFYAGQSDVRMVHTFVWDGDPERDFLAGLGLSVEVVLRDPPHDRHVRFAGPEGFLTEAVRGLTGLRRDPGESARQAQIAGRAVTEIEPGVAELLDLVPVWNDYTLDQTSADGFLLRKRTAPGHAWVTIPAGTRSDGYAYVGGVSGGLGFGLRDFWKLHPTRLDVRGAAGDVATATVWLWSPSAPAMDLRYWHDGLGQDTHAEQLRGLEITYEDYEPGFGTPHGIARTHELRLRVYPATPSHEELADEVAELNAPGLLVADPARLRAANVFGSWALPDPRHSDIEDRLDFLFRHYADQQEQRRWYGFWDYGDVMHTYDADRHTWRYDVGGYAWDNSELSPDLWLWYQFLRTGRAEIFRFAEAMTRHTGEVDVYHLGRWRGLGTRHNVQHWGCSCKQLRISNAAYRRFYYYLTADERTGDLLDELTDAEATFLAIDPIRKIRADAYAPDPRAVSIGLGTDWGALAAAWLTRWERHGDAQARDRLLGTMAGIGALPHGFLTGEALFDLVTGDLRAARPGISVSHLSAVFGLPEIIAELLDLDLGVPEFEDAWLAYCRLYLASPEQQAAAVGAPLTGVSLVQAHSRLAAYAAARTGDAELAALAWRKFSLDEGDQLNTNPLQRQAQWQTTRITGPQVLMPVTEASFVSTNDAAQYGLAAIQLLALAADKRPTAFGGPDPWSRSNDVPS
ncbi:hypothetical protein [Hamadaea sp.]|uniref:exo-rhamnogalacturonan lyase family protein n=1 Tax=Hamadaea sp. TaxID=2024425 RepID=UPI0025BFE716|nr:hypothetical protein [Hamadaea sp.]